MALGVQVSSEGLGESQGCQEEGLSQGRILFYRLRKSVQTVGVDRDLNRSVGILIADRWGKMVGMEGQMNQVSRGTDSDRQGPMESEERVVQM